MSENSGQDFKVEFAVGFADKTWDTITLVVPEDIVGQSLDEGFSWYDYIIGENQTFAKSVAFVTVISCNELESECQHGDDEDCLICISCGRCSESLNDADVCSECLEV